ncbi:YaiO family outer membrane beta-barrel protein [Chitinophaga agrisoli]|uniref:YaiO family outer membrane beta-barrel protein n=1 Tax=Chitinophaga agrisoli TaxID=2607653 RepID=A0A5B2VP91_9BACT|nr:YaiO family outer membrane beta-barrel protein [Chitinophaga agrisoli]KAA2240206.1 YaiO family outer membrane beta-barrel protein [Chitinophaga agrisoli]
MAPIIDRSLLDMTCIPNITRHCILLSLLALTAYWQAYAQERRSSDELFQDARHAAFEEKDYPQAIRLSRLALAQSPDYSEIRVFVGRVYTWGDHPDSARTEFHYVIQAHPDYEDAYVAITDLEYWNDRPDTALVYVTQGLQQHPQSAPLLLRKARVQAALKQLPEAAKTANALLVLYPSDAAGRALLSSIRDQVRKNKIDISYDYTYFDKRFDQAWHLLSVSYARQTKMGTILGRMNYANKFGEDGVQGEIEAYPRISKTFYAYVSAGYSGSDIFSKYRSGLSLYANLPASFEGEVGFRYLYFDDAVWIYTASIGKYYKNWWFNLRTFLTPGEGELSRSFAVTARYYTAGADDYFSIGLGTGVSPDDQRNNINYAINTNLITYKWLLGYQRTIWRQNIIGAGVTWYYEEYRKGTYGNQVNIGIMLQRRF